ncbi:hypothetical protein MGA3_06600 [Bacillus methanolicus MGA3]|nr:hypothetical protein MGA3_06600 [Bacillus methanolicus MGA3]
MIIKKAFAQVIRWARPFFVEKGRSCADKSRIANLLLARYMFSFVNFFSLAPLTPPYFVSYVSK